MFVSYAQNFEDVILHRALKSIENGFYIDIGAQDPVIDSVSLGFYELGWRGVHVEPNGVYAAKLRAARSDETVLELAVGEKTGVIPFFEIPDTGLSTADEAAAVKAAAAGYQAVRRETRCLKTSDLLDRYQHRAIHWLKIDAEGFEKQIIDGWRPSEVRPWIVAIEATLPMTPEPSHEDWEPSLLRLGYEFVYFDGLNRFYTSVQRPELKRHFGPGPNFFDDYVLSGMLHSPAGQRVLAALHGAQADAARLRLELETSKARRDGDYPRASLLQLWLLPWRRILTAIAFHANGRPRRLIRRLMFSSRGKVRPPFRRWVYSSKGRARPPFRRWLAGVPSNQKGNANPIVANEYLNAAPRHFLGRSQVEEARNALAAARSRAAGTGPLG